jgi:hypothetical protein
LQENLKKLKNTTAILIFANSAENDSERKSFLSREVFIELNNQTLKTVEKSGIEYYHFSEKNQVGNSFGERFSNAIEAIFNKGFKNVITIGNDTPHLKTRHLIDALHQLEKNELVLGPSKDGGFYLMGIQKAHFYKETFLKLPWQTNRLQKSIAIISSAKKLKTYFLELLFDIDSKEDINSIINSFKSISASILKLLLQLFLVDKKSFIYKQHTFYNLVFSAYFNKGSPLIFA